MSRKVLKRNKKALKLFSKLKFPKPFKVFLEEKFIDRYNKCQKRLKHLTRLLKSQPKLYVTSCVHRNYKKKERKYITEITKYVEIKPCGHTEPIPSTECMEQQINNTKSNKYIIALGNKKFKKDVVDKTDIPTIFCENQELKFEVKKSAVNLARGFIMEANEDELNRLESLFNESESDRDEE